MRVDVTDRYALSSKVALACCFGENGLHKLAIFQSFLSTLMR